PGSGQRRLPEACGDVKDPAAGLDPGERNQPLADDAGMVVEPARPFLPPRRGVIPLLSLRAPELNRINRHRLLLSRAKLSLAERCQPRARMVRVPDLQTAIGSPLVSVLQFQPPTVVPPELRALSSTEWASPQPVGRALDAEEVTG